MHVRVGGCQLACKLTIEIICVRQVPSPAASERMSDPAMVSSREVPRRACNVVGATGHEPMLRALVDMRDLTRRLLGQSH